MLVRVGQWYRRHWFLGTFAIIFALWAIVLTAYLAGAEQIIFGRVQGQKVSVDFGREHDHTVLHVSSEMGLSLMQGGPELWGTILELKPGLPVVCWVSTRVSRPRALSCNA